MASEDSKPTLQRMLEEICALMNLDQGRTRLEFVFRRGQLERYWVHDESKPPGDLHAFDGHANVLVGRSSA